MVVEESWGVAIEKAIRFFNSQADVKSRGTMYFFRSCQITLHPLEPGQFGKIPFPRTKLRIEGPEGEVRVIHGRFLIHFLTAGG